MIAIVAGGAVLLLFAVALVLLIVSALPGRGGDDVDARVGASEASATLTVFEDGCGVIRSDVVGEASNLTWSVRDEDGFEVLARNADSELQYRYFQTGTFTVVLTAFRDGAYRPISNTVTIRC